MSTFPQQIAFIDGVGGPEMMMIFFVVLLLFGGQKLPEFARTLGKTMRELRKATGNIEGEFKRAIDEVERSAQLNAPVDAPPLPKPAQPTAPSATSTPPHAPYPYESPDGFYGNPDYFAEGSTAPYAAPPAAAVSEEQASLSEDPAATLEDPSQLPAAPLAEPGSQTAEPVAPEAESTERATAP